MQSNYTLGEFSAFMSDKMSEESWYNFLHDLDILEQNCRLGYLGAYHLDIPYIAGLNLKETAFFYLKKTQLYQGKKAKKGLKRA